jgi:PleD family two-component response regulator
MLPTTKTTKAILVVDCDGSLDESAVPVLQQRGYEIFRASDAAGAMWILRRVNIDLVLLDACVKDAWELLEAKGADPRLSEIRLVLVSVGAGEIGVSDHGGVDEIVAPAYV